MTAPLTLRAGTVSADITGGELLTVSALRLGAVELLVDPADLPLGYRVHGARAGITLLHPWANRLGADVYEALGRRGDLSGGGARVSRDGNGLAIHGLLAPMPWSLTADGPSAATASLTWAAEPGFPFAHEITVRFALTADDDAGTTALHVGTTVTALGDDPVPVSFGWHPYFRRADPAEIELPALSDLAADAHGLPTGAQTPRAPTRAPLSDTSLDYGVAGLAAGAEMALHLPERTVGVSFDAGYPFGQVFAPHDAPVVSLEPMTAPTDALRSGSDLPVAAPGRPYVASFVVRIS